jgi:hypothetical protein
MSKTASHSEQLSYLVELQHHARELAARPAEWMHGTIARLWSELHRSPIRQSYDESLMAGKDTLRPYAGSVLKCRSNKGPAIENPAGILAGAKRRQHCSCWPVCSDLHS